LRFLIRGRSFSRERVQKVQRILTTDFTD
jgi:hypothetical protein